MSNLLVLIRPDGTLISTTPAAGPSLGYAPGEKVGTSIYDLIHAEDRDAIAARIAGSRPGPVWANRSTSACWRPTAHGVATSSSPTTCSTIRPSAASWSQPGT